MILAPCFFKMTWIPNLLGVGNGTRSLKLPNAKQWDFAVTTYLLPLTTLVTFVRFLRLPINTLVCTLLPTYPGKLTLITSLLRPTSCKRNFPLAPVSLKPPFIKYLVRSKLGNAAAIWDSSQVTLTANVESLQTRGARFMLANYHRTASVSPMKANLSLPLLWFRRRCSRLCLFYKIYHTNLILKETLLEPSHISSRLDHQFKVGIPHYQTSDYNDSFIPRTWSEGNFLPPSIISIP